MSAGSKSQFIPFNDFLEGELDSPLKHEYVAGTVYAMAGGTVSHNAVSSNCLVTLGSQLRGSGCQPFNSDMKVCIQRPEGDCAYYPDLSIVCDQNDSRRHLSGAPRLCF